MIVRYGEEKFQIEHCSMKLGGWSLSDEGIIPSEWDSIKFFIDKLEKYREPFVLDAHAGTGCFTIAACINPNARVMAMEPHPDILECLVSNLVANGLQQRVSVMAASPYNRDMTVILNIPEVIEYRTVCPKVHYEERMCVEGRMIDSMISKVDVMHISTAGGECMALQGAVEAIDMFKPDLMIDVSKMRDCNMKKSYITYELEHRGYVWRDIANGYIWAEINA